MAGIIYILTNSVMPGLVKIGITDNNVEARIKSLDNTSVPIPFECFFAAKVTDPARVERAIHEAFGDNRLRKSREFFRISPDKPKAIIELLSIGNATPGHDIVENTEDQEALNEERKRRSNFRFSLIGLKPGMELQSVFDDNITCVIQNDRWVQFRGSEHSLSSSALEIAHEKGLGWAAIAGPAYWKYNGKTLAELREESSSEE